MLPARAVRTCVPEKSRVKKLYIIKKRIIWQRQINLKSTVLLNSLNAACFFETLFFLTDASFFIPECEFSGARRVIHWQKDIFREKVGILRRQRQARFTCIKHEIGLACQLYLAEQLLFYPRKLLTRERFQMKEVVFCLSVVKRLQVRKKLLI